MRRQEKEILELKRRTETPSSALESDISPLVPKYQRKQSVSSVSGQVEMDIEDDVVIFCVLVRTATYLVVSG